MHSESLSVLGKWIELHQSSLDSYEYRLQRFAFDGARRMNESSLFCADERQIKLELSTQDTVLENSFKFIEYEKKPLALRHFFSVMILHHR